jgi:hypothetical protein
MAKKSTILRPRQNSERGIALLFTLLALVILTALTASLIMLSTTETSVNYNYRTEEIAFFAAKAGIYEAIDRMQQSNASSISAQVPTVLPSATGGVLYLINAGSSLTVQPWNTANKYFDNELCHEGYAITGMTAASPGIPCTTVPSGSSWYTTVSSNYPWSGTSASIPYEWVRITWKVNSSNQYLSGGPSNPATSFYSVNSTASSSTAVCWNGSSEVLLSAGDTTCGQMQYGTPSTADTPVYAITAMAITSNGSRQMARMEVAIPPPLITVIPGGFSSPDGFFAGASTCSPNGGTAPFTMANGVTVDGYDSSSGGTYSGTKSNSLGNIGSNGSVSMIGSTVGGAIYVTSTGVNGACGGSTVSDVYTSNGGAYGSIAKISSYTPAVPTIPAAGSSDLTVNTSQSLAPGSYRNLAVYSGSTLTLTAPGTFNFNCFVIGGGSTLKISPVTKQVIINVTGNSCSGNSVIDISNGTASNSSGIAANLTFNYAGTGEVNVAGGSTAYMVLNVPKAAVTLNNGSDIFGAIVAATINDSGGTKLHFDNALAASSGGTTIASTYSSSYTTIGFGSLPY